MLSPCSSAAFGLYLKAETNFFGSCKDMGAAVAGIEKVISGRQEAIVAARLSADWSHQKGT
jgi:hypothetical protein